MVLWPTMAVLGFLALAGLVIALGRESTARYEYERNSVEGLRLQQPAAAMAGAVAGSAGAVAPRLPLVQRETGMAAHPAGSRTPDRSSAPAWWLVDESDDAPVARAVAGPFDDRLDAEWAAVAAGLSASTGAIHGVQRVDGTVVAKRTTEDRAWLAELGGQLAGLPEEWDDLLSDTDELTTLVVEVGAALVEAGLPLHDGAERGPECGGPIGGVCLTPDPGSAAILVTWRQHDRMSVHQVRGAAVESAIQATMNSAVANVLAQCGFEVESVPASGCFRVTLGSADPG